MMPFPVAETKAAVGICVGIVEDSKIAVPAVTKGRAVRRMVVNGNYGADRRAH